MLHQLEKHKDMGLLVLRLGFGLGFLYFHGWGKLMGGPELWAGVGGAVEHIGIGFGHTFFGFLAALGESLGGLLIAAGLFFRPAVMFLGLVMFFAALQHIVTGQGSPGHAIKNLFVCAGLLTIGPGKYSLDEVICGDRCKVSDSE